MGDEKDDLLPIGDQLLQKLESREIHVIGRFVQKQDGRGIHQDPHQLGFDLFPAGKGLHELIPVEKVRLCPEGFRKAA